jgi:SAM-dependent methyltransferase
MQNSTPEVHVTCAICGGRAEPRVVGSERMFGLGGAYRYDMCVECGCLRLRDVPSRMDPFYASGYYSLTEPDAPSSVRQWYRRVRDDVLFGRSRWARSLLVPIVPRGIMEAGEWIARSGAGPNSRILDVGCGVGTLLRRLVDAGYGNAQGVDPFVDADIMYRSRLLVRRAPIEDVDGEFDLIMLHHSLEHIEAQASTMSSVARLLAADGTCLIRVPIVSSFAWDYYEDRWVQLDAPRHLFLHSAESMRRLAEGAGLRIHSMVHDSTAFQFEGSELYRRDIPLKDMGLHPPSRTQHLKYAGRAKRLNAQQRGDQAAFYLRHM